MDIGASLARLARARLNLNGEPASSLEDTLLWQQPSGRPPIPPLDSGLVDPPPATASNAIWVEFQYMWKVRKAQGTANPKTCDEWVSAIEKLLAWRKGLPVHLHFWAAESAH